MSPWVKSARPKTLPLSISAVLVGVSISNFYQPIDWFLLLLLLLIATSLQILSNFANDYGDYSKGTDKDANRSDRMLSSGEIQPSSMWSALKSLSFIILALGVYTIWYGFNRNLNNHTQLWFLLVFGIIAIAASIFYTVGKRAYGYSGFGDVAVFVFFGLMPVLGSSIMAGVELGIDAILGGVGMGFLSASILNINNYRDLETDERSNKNTLAVYLGPKKTLIYQRFLLVLGFLGVFGSMAFFLNQILKLSSSSYYIEMFLLFGVFSPSAVFLSRFYSETKELNPGDRDGLNKQLKNNSLTILLLAVVHFTLSLYIGGFFR